MLSQLHRNSRCKLLNDLASAVFSCKRSFSSDFLPKKGQESNQVLRDIKTIRSLLSTNQIEAAESVFMHMSTENKSPSSAALLKRILGFYKKEKDWHGIIKLFESFSSSSNVSQRSLELAIEAYSNVGNVEGVERIFYKFHGVPGIRFPYQTFFYALISANEVDLAVSVLKSINPSNTLMIQDDAFQPFLSHFKGNIHQLEMIIGEMERLYVPFSLHSISRITRSYLKAGSLVKAREWLDRIGQVRDPRLFSLAMLVYSRTADIRRATALMEQAKLIGFDVLPDLWIGLQRAHCEALDTEKALECLEEMKKRGMDPGPLVYSNLVMLFARSRRIEEMEMYFKKLLGFGEQLEPRFYFKALKYMIKGYGEAGMHDKVDKVNALLDGSDHVPIDVYRELAKYSTSLDLLSQVNAKLSTTIDQRELKKAVTAGNFITRLFIRKKQLQNAHENSIALFKATGSCGSFLPLLDHFSKNGSWDDIKGIIEEAGPKQLLSYGIALHMILQGLERLRMSNHVLILGSKLVGFPYNDPIPQNLLFIYANIPRFIEKPKGYYEILFRILLRNSGKRKGEVERHLKAKYPLEASTLNDK